MTSRRDCRRLVIWTLMICLLVVVTAISGFQTVRGEEEKLWREQSSTIAIPSEYLLFHEIFNSANPAVVNISTLQGGRSTPNFLTTPGAQPRKNLGSGTIIRADGYIVTNHHVIQNASDIAVTLANGKIHRAKLIGKDTLADVALIKIDGGKNFPTLPFGDSTKVAVGHWVLAIGNPFGFNNTMTHGIVSAVGRVISNEERRKRFDDFIQIDASINPGNSGGPLLNLGGEVVGMNTAMTAAGAGIAFAVPINKVKKIVSDLYLYGVVKRGWIGVVCRELDDKEVARLNAEEERGLIVLELSPDSPAQKSGLRKDDRIVKVDGQKVNTLFDLSNIIAESSPGSKMVLEIVRQGKAVSLTVNVENLDRKPVP